MAATGISGAAATGISGVRTTGMCGAAATGISGVRTTGIRGVVATGMCGVTAMICTTRARIMAVPGVTALGCRGGGRTASIAIPRQCLRPAWW